MEITLTLSTLLLLLSLQNCVCKWWLVSLQNCTRPQHLEIWGGGVPKLHLAKASPELAG